MSNRFEKIKTWLQNCPYVDDYIYLNVLPNEVEDTSISSDAGIPGVIQEFINGDKQMELLFNVSIVKVYDKGTSDLNSDALTTFENIDRWVKEQNKLKNYPDFSPCIIYNIDSYYTNPDIFISEDESKCEYRAKYKVDYLEKGDD